MAEITLTNIQKVLVTVNPEIKPGMPAAIDGDATFTVGAGDCTIVVVDGRSAYIVSGDNPGDSTIVVSADADLGAGVETISDSITVHVQGARATSLGLSIGTPEAK